MVTGGRVTGAAALRIVGRMFIILGIVAFVVSGVLAIIEMCGHRTASTFGKIVAAEYYPIIQFSTRDGVVIRFSSAVHSSSFGVGDSVAVDYDPNNPHNASIGSFVGRWFDAELAGVVGGILLLIGIVLTVLRRVLMRRIVGK